MKHAPIALTVLQRALNFHPLVAPIRQRVETLVDVVSTPPIAYHKMKSEINTQTLNEPPTF